MRLFVEDPRDPIGYKPAFREYYIKLHNQPKIITFSFCPWCGKELPSSLRVEFFEVLDREYDIDISIGEYKDNESIPEEFKDDKWWRKRKL